MDVSSYSEENDGVTFLLTCIDLLSRYAWVRTLKSKKTSDVAKALTGIFNEGRQPARMRVDLGNEYKGPVATLLRRRDVSLILAVSDTGANYAERFHRTLRSKLVKYMYKNNTLKYIDALQKLVESYNKTKHSSINMRPVDVTEADVPKLLRWRLKIKKPKRFGFKLDETVRVSQARHSFTREFNMKWSNEVFEIAKRYRVQNINVYNLRNVGGELVHGSFYEPELQSVVAGEKHRIEKVLKTKGDKSLVHWLGYSSKQATWVPTSFITGHS